MPEINRRSLLQFAGAATLGAGLAGTLAPMANARPIALPRATTNAAAKWPGHQPGKIYLGLSSQPPLDETLDRTGPVGVNRTYYGWAFGPGERKTIAADHAADRLPWVSFKPPSRSRSAWRSIANGVYDKDIRARARGYAELNGPVIATFHHEPTDNHPDLGADFSAAWCRIHDVMKQETNLQNVISVPIIGDWAFNPKNRGTDPADWATHAILDRCHLLGIDLYQNRSSDGYNVRLGRILEFLDDRGHSDKMVGLGETGATDDYPYGTGAEWWNASWSWAAANADRVGVISYFNSQRNNNSGNTWLLWESQEKLNAYKSSLRSSKATRLQAHSFVPNN